MTRLLIGAFSLVLLLGAYLAGGTAPFGRVALSLGAPGIAATLFDDHDWKGAALYRAGKLEDAASSFRVAGPGTFYNLGNALAVSEEFAAALEAYDAALAQFPNDAAAEANYDLVAAFYAGTQVDPDAFVEWSSEKEGPTVAAAVARGSARAAGTGDGITNTGALLGLPEVTSTGRLAIRKVFDDKFMVASPRWLATLEDVPGAYLAERISHEHKRRAKAGTGQPPGEEP